MRGVVTGEKGNDGRLEKGGLRSWKTCRVGRLKKSLHRREK